MKRNFGKETKPSLGTVFNIAEVKLRRRRMSAAINCCSYLSLQTSLADPNKYIKQSGHEVNSSNGTESSSSKRHFREDLGGYSESKQYTEEDLVKQTSSPRL